ncbi:hypothetical protein [Saccharibacillus alkalitolerans]|uniref:Uncharacterized protein n=1 Tax=Saccharibacillus alkalitolerans TaxID=2705290 RepID=A0ABX0F9R6_9BACL|nr:hypothetical protein [Saccharibacillus alkalitolerans]NGZ76719.1 hypothetical protein [Saccharibacillus alkalitolerans]
MNVEVQALGFFGLLITVVLLAILLFVVYWIIRLAINHSDAKEEVYALRQDLNELERRQAERFERQEALQQEQNALLREQNERLGNIKGAD